MSLEPKVAVSTDALTALFKIPRKQQEKVREFVERFRANPTSPGINYEKIKEARDPNLRSVRIDDTYRGIILKPDTGDLFLLLWVDRHDEAYAWAKNRVCKVNPEIGSLQLYEVKEEPRSESKEETTPARPGLFDSVRDRHLLKMGIPEELLPALRQVRTEEDLDRFMEGLPQEAADALTLLRLGCSPEEIIRDIESQRPVEKIDPKDYVRALQTDESRSRFFIAEDDLELQAILQAPLEKWRVFLHPTQRRLVERSWNGPVRVLGGAGTGKTVAALHRARWLAQNVLANPNEKVLFTTFTKNLAEDIRDNLAKICPDELLKRIEVVNLDRWVNRYLKGKGYESRLLYDEERRRELWGMALTYRPEDPALPDSFYFEEWERVIQPQEVSSEKEYFLADRRGRGVALNRIQRKAVWPVFEEYRALLREKGLSEFDDAMRDARKVLEETGERLPYRAIVVDEAQDLGPLAFKLIRKMVPEGKDDLFIVGDAHQRIYRHKVALSACGIEVRGRSRKLRVNYRTTEETRRWAVRLLEGQSYDDLDGGQDDQKGYRSVLHGLAPRLEGFEFLQEEASFLADYLKELQRSGENLANICLTARTQVLLNQYQTILEGKGVKTVRIQPDQAENRREEGVRLATMHRVKGLEFDRMIIAGVGSGQFPPKFGASEDHLVEEERLRMERSLLYVAATRARTHLLVTWHGEPSKMLGTIEE